jgi:hypothetical protein
MNAHRLVGLEPDNLLAFMALLGLLRALETAEPAWRPRAYWDETHHPLRPMLTLAQAKTQEEIAEAAARGVRRAGEGLQALCSKAAEIEIDRCREEEREKEAELRKETEGKKKQKLQDALKKLRNRMTNLGESSDGLTDLARSHANLVTLLGSDVGIQPWIAALSCEVLDDEAFSAKSTPLKFGSGQMPFVGALATLTTNVSDFEIARSLFAMWEYRHRGESLRLSPGELRLYAHRGSDPSKKESIGRRGRQSNEPEITGTGVAPSERGANSLAALGFLSFPIFTRRRRAGAPGLSAASADEYITWPILGAKNGRGFSRAVFEASLWVSTPTSNAASASSRLMRARIVEVEDYKSISGGRFIDSQNE